MPALAHVVVGFLDTVKAALGVTGARQTLVDIALTVLASKARGAAAGVAPDAIDALPSIEAARPPAGVGIWSTVIIVDLTLQPCNTHTRTRTRTTLIPATSSRTV